MPKYTVAIFVGLVVVGAIVAWAGDAIGARLGKQRASVFGLRPRQSARLVAVVIGGLLPLVGLGWAMAGSEYARIAVFRLEALLRQQTDLTRRVAELQEEARSESARAKAAETKAQQAEQEADSLDRQRLALVEEVSRLQERQATLQARVREAEQKVREAEQKVREAEQKVREAEQKVREAEQKLKESEQKLAEAEQKRHELEQANQQLRDDNRDLGIERSNFLNARDDALRAKEGAVEELAGWQRKLALAEQEVADRKQELADLQQEYAALRQEFAAYRERQGEIAEKPALFDPGDELMRVVLSSEQTQDQIEGELWEILHVAGPIAEAKGVPIGGNGRAIVLVAPVPASAPSLAVPESAIVQYVASELRAGEAKEYVVLLRAFRRLSAEDHRQLEVRFLASPNLLKFKKGEVLVEVRIPAELPRLEIFETLWRLVADPEASQVRAIARAAEMLPHPKTGQYGSFTLADMFSAADEVRGLEGLVPVRIAAAQDTYTVGPLLIEIQVGEREEP